MAAILKKLSRGSAADHFERFPALFVAEIPHCQLNKLTSVFYASVLLLMINFVITYVKVL